MSSEIEDWIEENFPKATAENLRRRLAEADVNGAWYTRQIDCFLEQQKGGDMTDYSGIVEQQKQRIAELERLYKAAMRSAEDHCQAASVAEERAERLEKELSAQRDGAEAARAGRPISDCPYASNAVSVEFRNAELQGCWQRGHDSATIHMLGGVENVTRELNSLRRENDQLKSVRVLSGEEIYKGLRECGADFVRYENAKDDHEAFERFAERLQLRCTCPPMDNQELWDFLSSREVETYKEACRRLADHIWPKVAPKPTREEVAGRIAEAFRNDVMTVFELQGKSALASSAFGDGAWYAEIVGDNSAYSSHSSRTEAEQAAREMLVDAVMSKTKN